MRAIRPFAIAASAIAVLAIAACVNLRGTDEDRVRAKAVMQRSFTPRGQAQLDRLDQDDTQRTCSEAEARRRPLDAAAAARIEGENARLIKWPLKGYLGDWRRGEAIAQSGVGRQYSDPPDAPAGGNCYACHQVSPAEISYGNIGPSLLGYGKKTDAMSREERERYTYGQIYDAEAYNACTNMPRFGAKGILTETQIRDLVALLLDPLSPVNNR